MASQSENFIPRPRFEVSDQVYENFIILSSCQIYLNFVENNRNFPLAYAILSIGDNWSLINTLNRIDRNDDITLPENIESLSEINYGLRVYSDEKDYNNIFFQIQNDQDDRIVIDLPIVFIIYYGEKDNMETLLNDMGITILEYGTEKEISIFQIREQGTIFYLQTS